ncbi:hypothetical protein DL769_006703 [Monosporascus sp. CRB-8-3]|nr:hypothetical protein DL769_006703 [Monosporascus sp. CRB-8-3]
MKGENILVGDIIPNDTPEHNITPLTKIIDFGRGELIEQVGPRYEDSNSGIVENLWGVGRDLACNMNPRTYNPNKKDILRVQIKYEDGSKYFINTQASEELARTARVDPYLQSLIYRLMADRQRDVPGLTEVLRICEKAVATKTPTDYAPPGYDNPLETDQAITTMFQRVILDAGEERQEVEDIMEGFGHVLG